MILVIIAIQILIYKNLKTMKKNNTILLLIALIVVTFIISCKKNAFNEETQVESLSRRGFKLESKGKLFSEYRKGDSVTLLKRGTENAIISTSFHSYTKYSIDPSRCIMSAQMAQASNDYVDDYGTASHMGDLAIKLNLPGIQSVSYTAEDSLHQNPSTGYYSFNGSITFYWDDSFNAINSQWFLDAAADVSPDQSFKIIL